MPRNKAKRLPALDAGKSRPLPEVEGLPKPLRALAVRHRRPDNDDWYTQHHPTWSFSMADLEYDGSWSWTQLSQDIQELLGFMKSIEPSTWKEIFNQIRPAKQGRGNSKHHGVACEQLTKEARDRLGVLDLTDLDQLYSLYVASKKRVWGVMLPKCAVFFVLWWDRDHLVYPVTRD